MTAKSLQIGKQQLEKIQDWVQRAHAAWVAKGNKLTYYICPSCQEMIETRRPTEADVDKRGYWDSLAACPRCGEVSFLQIYTNGDVFVDGDDATVRS